MGCLTKLSSMSHAQRALLRAVSTRSWAAHVTTAYRRRHGPILRLIGSKYAWACRLLVTPYVWVPLRAGCDCKCVAYLSHDDLLQTNCPHNCFCILTPPRCKNRLASISTELMRQDSTHDCTLSHIFGVWYCANSGKLMGLPVKKTT